MLRIRLSSSKARKVLIYRLGSLGDTVVALPCFHLIARSFPNAERRVLTNFSVNGKAAPLRAILGDSGLVHGYMEYRIGLRDYWRFQELRTRIRSWRPDVLVYLAEPRGRLKVLRDALFFKACGIRTLVGVPYTKHLQQNRWLNGAQCYEPEAERLARCLKGLSDAQLDQPASWDLRLTAPEVDHAQQCMNGWAGERQFIACSVGTKVNVNDWGIENWQRLLYELSHEYSDYRLVMIGAGEEVKQSEAACGEWRGPALNLCGKLTPRESAAALKHASLFLGHDSGPMHLAASVGVPCVAIFSARNKPRVWFPYGSQHEVLYHKTPCYGCGLEVCVRYQKKCITSITVAEVLEAVHRVMARRGSGRQ